MLTRNVTLLTALFIGFVSIMQLNAAEDGENGKMPAVVKPGADVEKVATGFKFTEGPAADSQGRIWFTDIPNNRIHRFDPATGKTEVMHEQTEACNGLMFKGDKLLACSHGKRKLVSFNGEGNIEVLAETFEEDGQTKIFNSPNDLDIDPKGGVYFTDPRYGNRDNMEMTECVYYRTWDGKVIRVIDDLVRPNGLIMNQDGTILYVSDNGASLVYAYDIKTDGTLMNKRLFARNKGLDGMTLDKRGNVYVTDPKGISVYDKEGKHLGVIAFPEKPANVSFGGKDNTTLYVTARTSLYRIEMAVKGRGRVIQE